MPRLGDPANRATSRSRYVLRKAPRALRNARCVPAGRAEGAAYPAARVAPSDSPGPAASPGASPTTPRGRHVTASAPSFLCASTARSAKERRRQHADSETTGTRRSRSGSPESVGPARSRTSRASGASSAVGSRRSLFRISAPASAGANASRANATAREAPAKWFRTSSARPAATSARTNRVSSSVNSEREDVGRSPCRPSRSFANARNSSRSIACSAHLSAPRRAFEEASRLPAAACASAASEKHSNVRRITNARANDLLSHVSAAARAASSQAASAPSQSRASRRASASASAPRMEPWCERVDEEEVDAVSFVAFV